MSQIMRTVVDIFVQIFRNLWAHKLRSFLTMFGIAWGVGSLLLLVGLGEGFRSGQKKNMANLGSDVMFTYSDYLAVKNEAQHLRAVSAVINREDIRAVSEFGSTNGQVFGVEPVYNQIRNVPVGTGRWLNDEDNSEHRRVAVVG